MRPRLFGLLALTAMLGAQPAWAHPNSPDIAIASSSGVLATILHLTDSDNHRVGTLAIYIHQDGVTLTNAGPVLGPWYSAQLSLFAGEELRASGSLSAGTVDIDPATGVHINATLGAIGTLHMTAVEPTSVASNLGCAGYQSTSPDPNPHNHYWMASLVRVEPYGASAAGTLGPHEIEERAVLFAESGLAKIQVDVPPVIVSPPLCL